VGERDTLVSSFSPPFPVVPFYLLPSFISLVWRKRSLFPLLSTTKKSHRTIIGPFPPARASGKGPISSPDVLLPPVSPWHEYCSRLGPREKGLSGVKGKTQGRN